MDYALKISRLIANTAEIIMAAIVAADTIDSISERRAKGTASVANGIPAYDGMPESTNN